MIDVLEEIALLEKIKDAASEQDYGKVIELCADKIHENVKAVKDFERAYAQDSFVAAIRRQDAKAADQ